LRDRLQSDCASKRQTRRALVEGLQVLNRTARSRGAPDFVALASDQRHAVLEACARAAPGSVPEFFYRTVRDRAMQLAYSHPITWKRLGFAHPPQPEGYLNYWEPPDV
jgi:hypothetical protein